MDNASNSKFTNQAIFIVLLIVALVLTFGWFVKAKKESVGNSIELLQQRLNYIKLRIQELSAIKESLEKRKKKILLYSRLILGVLIIALNLYLLTIIKPNPKLDSIINALLTVNGALLMAYSFIAFISYGSIDNFITALKRKVAYSMEKRHFDSLEELNYLQKELIEIEAKLHSQQVELLKLEHILAMD